MSTQSIAAIGQKLMPVLGAVIIGAAVASYVWGPVVGFAVFAALFCFWLAALSAAIIEQSNLDQVREAREKRRRLREQRCPVPPPNNSRPTCGV